MRFKLPQNGYTNPRKLYHEKKNFARGFCKKCRKCFTGLLKAGKAFVFMVIFYRFHGYSLCSPFYCNVTVLSLYLTLGMLLTIHIWIGTFSFLSDLVLDFAIFYHVYWPDQCMFLAINRPGYCISCIGIDSIRFRTIPVAQKQLFVLILFHSFTFT